MLLKSLAEKWMQLHLQLASAHTSLQWLSYEYRSAESFRWIGIYVPLGHHGSRLAKHVSKLGLKITEVVRGNKAQTFIISTYIYGNRVPTGRCDDAPHHGPIYPHNRFRAAPHLLMWHHESKSCVSISVIHAIICHVSWIIMLRFSPFCFFLFFFGFPFFTVASFEHKVNKQFSLTSGGHNW